MHTHGLRADVQRAADLSIGHTLGQQGEHVPLPWCQEVGHRRPRSGAGVQRDLQPGPPHQCRHCLGKWLGAQRACRRVSRQRVLGGVVGSIGPHQRLCEPPAAARGLVHVAVVERRQRGLPQLDVGLPLQAGGFGLGTRQPGPALEAERSAAWHAVLGPSSNVLHHPEPGPASRRDLAAAAVQGRVLGQVGVRRQGEGTEPDAAEVPLAPHLAEERDDLSRCLYGLPLPALPAQVIGAQTARYERDLPILVPCGPQLGQSVPGHLVAAGDQDVERRGREPRRRDVGRSAAGQLGGIEAAGPVTDDVLGDHLQYPRLERVARPGESMGVGDRDGGGQPDERLGHVAFVERAGRQIVGSLELLVGVPARLGEVACPDQFGLGAAAAHVQDRLGDQDVGLDVGEPEFAGSVLGTGGELTDPADVGGLAGVVRDARRGPGIVSCGAHGRVGSRPVRQQVHRPLGRFDALAVAVGVIQVLREPEFAQGQQFRVAALARHPVACTAGEGDRPARLAGVGGRTGTAVHSVNARSRWTRASAGACSVVASLAARTLAASATGRS